MPKILICLLEYATKLYHGICHMTMHSYITSCLIFKVSALCNYLAYYMPLTVYLSFIVRQDMQKAIDYCFVIYYGLDIYARAVLRI